MAEAADGSADIIFFINSAPFINRVKSHKKLILEAQFFQEGAQQFKFDLTGFNNPRT